MSFAFPSYYSREESIVDEYSDKRATVDTYLVRSESVYIPCVLWTIILFVQLSVIPKMINWVSKNFIVKLKNNKYSDIQVRNWGSSNTVKWN